MSLCIPIASRVMSPLSFLILFESSLSFLSLDESFVTFVCLFKQPAFKLIDPSCSFSGLFHSFQPWTLYFLPSTNFQFSSVVSDSLRPRGLQQARLFCPSPTPGDCSDSCPSSQWCHPTISSSIVPFSLLPSIFPSIRVFSNESALLIRWPKYWSFSFNLSPSSEHPGLISFRMDWLDLFVVQEFCNSSTY